MFRRSATAHYTTLHTTLGHVVCAAGLDPQRKGAVVSSFCRILVVKMLSLSCEAKKKGLKIR